MTDKKTSGIRVGMYMHKDIVNKLDKIVEHERLSDGSYVLNRRNVLDNLIQKEYAKLGFKEQD